MSIQDMEIMTNLERLKNEIKIININLDHITDPILIDSYIFENMALNMRYKYFLRLCKERGLKAEGF